MQGTRELRRVLIANRGEIALRIIRACRRQGLETVAVYSAADANSPHVWAADKAVRIGPAPPTESYLKTQALLHVAQASGCDAVHPGYGFLAENTDFARKCEEEGITFIGPPAEVIARMGDKSSARAVAAELGVPVVPGSEQAFVNASEATAAAKRIGFPILLKARSGGGGRGMRVAWKSDGFEDLFRQAQREAEAAFVDGAIYIERFFPAVRHVEVQVFGDKHGHVRHLWERDCTVQRRHQKLVEESLSPVLDKTTREKICEAAEILARGIGYVGAGTVEFIYDPPASAFYFIEMNTRIQVEHPVTEALTGIDLIIEQLTVAAGHELSFLNRQNAISGHAMEFRINAEDPDRNFAPSPGCVIAWDPPIGDGIRLDSHVYKGYDVAPFYDSLLGKLIVRGTDRGDAIERARAAISGFRIAGVATTLPFYRWLLRQADFVEGRMHTRWIEERIGGTGGPFD